jgi:flagellar biosynthetic protein FlhB
VALKYDPTTMIAPKVVSRGMHRLALRLRRMAFLYGVVIVHEPQLARALYRCEVNQTAPEALYRSLADIYRKLRADRAETSREEEGV